MLDALFTDVYADLALPGKNAPLSSVSLVTRISKAPFHSVVRWPSFWLVALGLFYGYSTLYRGQQYRTAGLMYLFSTFIYHLLRRNSGKIAKFLANASLWGHLFPSWLDALFKRPVLLVAALSVGVGSCCVGLTSFVGLIIQGIFAVKIALAVPAVLGSLGALVVFVLAFLVVRRVYGFIERLVFSVLLSLVGASLLVGVAVVSFKSVAVMLEETHQAWKGWSVLLLAGSGMFAQLGMLRWKK